MASDTALLIIDIQAGMLDEADPDCKAILDNINSLLDRARASGTPVIYIQHDGWPAGHPLEPGTPGWPIHPAIAPHEGEPVIRKRASDSFYRTPLQDELEKLGVRRLVVAGAQSEYCVDTTCRSALSHGYDVTLVSDAHDTANGHHLTADEIIAYHNHVLARLTHPDHAITVAATDAVTF